jgi:acetate kinase
VKTVQRSPGKSLGPMQSSGTDKNAMTSRAGSSVLTLNAGSSSIKFALFEREVDRGEIARGKLDGIGSKNAKLLLKISAPHAESEQPVDARQPSDALDAILQAISPWLKPETLAGVGHRVVHGGPSFSAPQRVTQKLMSELQGLAPLDPDHLPAGIKLIEATEKRIPGVPQVVCFDTAFHHDLPKVAQMFPLPRQYFDAGVRRYGFHGLSYQFLIAELARLGDSAAQRGRVIIAHLGNGASMAAIRNGRSIDTSMGFTPASGFPMSSRAGDLDPGIVAYLARTEKMTSDRFNHLVNHESGLLGISQISADMRVLLAREKSDARAVDAIAIFCYEAKKYLGAYSSALEGLDTLVFSGGIGENCPEIRRRICAGLEFLGLDFDHASNEAGADVISTTNSRVTVRVIRTNEEIVIARAVTVLLKT